MLVSRCGFHVRYKSVYEYFFGRKRKWLLSAVVIKINREYLCTIKMKNGRVSISSSMLINNKCVCLKCNAIVAVSKK
jgi:hypothetical protein